jgi:hypothetical protein
MAQFYPRNVHRLAADYENDPEADNPGAESVMRRFIVPVLLLALAGGVSGCVYGGGGHGWCWYHPHKCP